MEPKRPSDAGSSRQPTSSNGTASRLVLDEVELWDRIRIDKGAVKQDKKHNSNTFWSCPTIDMTLYDMLTLPGPDDDKLMTFCQSNGNPKVTFTCKICFSEGQMPEPTKISAVRSHAGSQAHIRAVQVCSIAGTNNASWL